MIGLVATLSPSSCKMCPHRLLHFNFPVTKHAPNSLRHQIRAIKYSISLGTILTACLENTTGFIAHFQMFHENTMLFA